MDNARQQIVDSITGNSNILVTVSTNPSVDELSAALGLTILLNNIDKRATAVFSGATPPAIKFLEPDKTFEGTADSLRDFIIALDKEKADHLRYKVDGDVVKIFITPYRTTLTQKDLDFSQGDYNVELVVAIGVKDQDHLDKALAAHGKILHDATVVTVTAGQDVSSLGTIDWHDGAASSLSEMVVSLVDGLKTDTSLLDEQIATALLTGIVSATDRFSNDRTSSRVMTMAAQLMAAGANQQLIAAKLAEAHDIAPSPAGGKKTTDTASTQEKKARPATNELSIDRSERKPKEEQKSDTATEEEVPGQQELEAQLADLSAATAAVTAAPSLEDLEKELKQDVDAQTPVDATDAELATEEVADDAPLTAATDTAMPGFEPTDTDLSGSEMPALPPQPAAEAETPVAPEMPPIINQHGTLSEPPVEQQPLNSINAAPVAGDATIDPFTAPVSPADNTLIEEPMVPPPLTAATPLVTPVAPVVPLGTDASVPQSDMTVPPLPALAPEPAPIVMPEPAIASVAPAVEVPSLPPLPPLPPLPSDGSLPPLPPPPPLPDFGQTAAGMPTGPMSTDQFNDIFGGDAVTPASASPAPSEPTPPNPGQFKIPGQ